MKKYSPKSSSPTRLDYGQELDAGLTGSPETAPLAEELAPANRNLEEAYQARLAGNRAVVRSRAVVRITEYQAEREVRSFARGLEIAEGGRRGPAFDAILPDGIQPVLAPRRAAQARAIRLLLEALRACTIPAAVRAAIEWVPRLTAIAERLEAAVTAHDEAIAAQEAAFRTELRRRDEHERTVEQLMGRVRTLFPGDRAAQDAVFPTVDSSPAHKEESDGTPTAPASPTPPATPAPVA
jgi:hypothetical protein